MSINRSKTPSPRCVNYCSSSAENLQDCKECFSSWMSFFGKLLSVDVNMQSPVASNGEWFRLVDPLIWCSRCNDDDRLVSIDGIEKFHLPLIGNELRYTGITHTQLSSRQSTVELLHLKSIPRFPIDMGLTGQFFHFFLLLTAGIDHVFVMDHFRPRGKVTDLEKMQGQLFFSGESGSSLQWFQIPALRTEFPFE